MGEERYQNKVFPQASTAKILKPPSMLIIRAMTGTWVVSNHIGVDWACFAIVIQVLSIKTPL